MHNPQPSPDPLPGIGHELTDASPRGIALSIIGLATLLALTLALVTEFSRFLETDAARHHSPVSPLLGGQIPPQPRLQPDPAADLATHRAAEEQRMSSYGWVDEEKQIVRLPIERAIDILAERGFPEPTGPVEFQPPEERQP